MKSTLDTLVVHPFITGKALIALPVFKFLAQYQRSNAAISGF